MKFLYITTLAICANLSLFADIKYDPIEQRYFSLPKSNKINLQEYNALIYGFVPVLCKLSEFEVKANKSMPVELFWRHLKRYLTKHKTYTAKRLLADFSKLQEQSVDGTKQIYPFHLLDY